MRAARAGQAARACARSLRGRAGRARKPAFCRAPTYAHYPRYPQAESAWCDSDSVTASGCGRDDLPATEESLPSHSPGGCLTPSSDWRSAEADGRAADEAAAMRTRTGLPFSGCDGGRLRTAPIGTGTAFGHGWNRHRTTGLRAGGTDRRDTGSHDPGPARRKAMSSDKRAATGAKGLRLRRVGQDRVSARELRTRHGPRASAHGHVRRNRGFGRGSCRTRFRGLRSMKTPGSGRGTRVPNPPSGEPPGLRPCAGSQRGPLTRLRPSTDSGDVGPGPCSGYRPRKSPLRKACLGGTGREGTVGPGSDAGPHFCPGIPSPTWGVGPPAKRVGG